MKQITKREYIKTLKCIRYLINIGVFSSREAEMAQQELVVSNLGKNKHRYYVK